MAEFGFNGDSIKSSVTNIQREQDSNTEGNRHNRNKSVQWADWELKDVMEFSSEIRDKETLIDEYSQTEICADQGDDPFPLIDSLVQTSLDISSLASRSSRSASMTTCTTMEDDDAKQAALSDLIAHLEDTAALLREYMLPPKQESVIEDIISYEQTTFLLKYQIILVAFTQLVSILILSLFDHLTIKVRDTGYHMLTIACGSVLQILNMLLVSFATAVLSRQMLKYKVEGSLMAQTYLATVITFAGLYLMIYRIEPTSWEFSSSDKIEENIAFGQFIKMLYLSVSAATLCGAANIQPNAWFVTLILCFQIFFHSNNYHPGVHFLNYNALFYVSKSLINFVYFASILAQTIGNYHSYTVQVRRSSSMSHLRGKT